MPDRIARLRDACLNRPVDLRRFSLHRVEGASRCAEGTPLIRRSAAATVHLFDNVPVEIKPDELIVGSSAAVLSATDRERWEELERYHGFMNEGARGGITAHTAIDNDRLLKEGVSGTMARIERKLSELDPADPARERKAEFYDCARSVLEGLVRFANRYADEANRLAAAERNPAR